MSRKFFQTYSRKYFRHKTENSSYCLVGEISTLLGKIDIFHNLSGKRSKKSEQISVFVEYNMWNNIIISAFHGKNFLQLTRFVKCSHQFDIFSNSSEIIPKVRSIFLKPMKFFHFL